MCSNLFAKHMSQCPVVRIVGDSGFQSRDEIYKVNIVNSLYATYTYKFIRKVTTTYTSYQFID